MPGKLKVTVHEIPPFTRDRKEVDVSLPVLELPADAKGDTRSIEALAQLIRANPEADDATIAAAYATDHVYDQVIPRETRKTHYDPEDRMERAMRFLLPHARKAVAS